MAPACGSRHVSRPPKRATHSRAIGRLWRRMARGARVAALAILRLDRDPRDAVRHLVRADGQVVVLRPAVRATTSAADDPADADAGNPVGLRQAARDDHAVAHAPEARRARAVDFRAEIHLVGEKPRAGRLAAV